MWKMLFDVCNIVDFRILLLNWILSCCKIFSEQKDGCYAYDLKLVCKFLSGNFSKSWGKISIMELWTAILEKIYCQTSTSTRCASVQRVLVTFTINELWIYQVEMIWMILGNRVIISMTEAFNFLQFLIFCFLYCF